jgi:hypothetical protein
VLELAESPLRLFFYFMSPRLWRRIAKESNRYYDQQLNARVDRMLSAQHARGEESSREEVMLRETKSQKKIQPEDIVHCIGLLVARMLCPHKRKFADHWAKTGVGAVPKGTFGQFVRRARFDRIMQSLHFTNNTDPRAETDRAWKVRSVVETLQETFRRGYKTPPVLSFDEAMIPSRSRHNVTRQFMKDKPHKWGTKLFMTYYADTAYCLRYVECDSRLLRVSAGLVLAKCRMLSIYSCCSYVWCIYNVLGLRSSAGRISTRTNLEGRRHRSFRQTPTQGLLPSYGTSTRSSHPLETACSTLWSPIGAARTAVAGSQRVSGGDYPDEQERISALPDHERSHPPSRH